MEKVVILARVSTDKQDYERQVNELTDYCRKMDWEVEKVFTNKVSGAKSNEEREEIQELIEFVKTNQIQRVVCLEISRMGRNTLEALKVIQLLNEHKVSLYVKNYNLETLDSEGKVNPVASLICTILLEIAQMERLTIKERMASGRKQYIDRCRREGVKMGRPDTYHKNIEEYKKQYQREFSLIRKGLSLANISAITGTSINTIRKLRIMVKEGRV
ncbi:MAG: recombinase family protein [Alistipes sp.]|nr:recombinase family protein [Alistipes sp.]